MISLIPSRLTLLALYTLSLPGDDVLWKTW